MTSHSVMLKLLTEIQKRPEHATEGFVMDFLDIWLEIHKRTEGISIEEALTICKSLLESHILPFFKNHGKGENLQYYNEWIDIFASIFFKWQDRGGFLFPLTLVIYEIHYRNELLLYEVLKKIKVGVLKGCKSVLYEVVFPTLSNFVVPLDELDIDLLKAHRTLQSAKTLLFKDPSKKAIAEVLNVSTSTITRRMKVLNFLQIIRAMHFLDMGKMGYETSLMVHSNSFPKEFEKYLLQSSNLLIGTFSIVQIPISQFRVQSELQDKLELLFSYPMQRRITAWNLNSLSPGKYPWKNSPPFIFANPMSNILIPSTDLDLNLRPEFNKFRELTKADYKILDFIAREGSFENFNAFSKSININRLEISNRSKEYAKANLTYKSYQFFNIGLELSIFFFISDVGTKIQWVDHLLTFPKADVFIQQEESPNTYFGYLKLPNKWIKSFARKIDLIRNEYDVKIYYKIASAVDHFKWGISLADTYHHH